MRSGVYICILYSFTFMVTVLLTDNLGVVNISTEEPPPLVRVSDLVFLRFLSDSPLPPELRQRGRGDVCVVFNLMTSIVLLSQLCVQFKEHVKRNFH